MMYNSIYFIGEDMKSDDKRIDVINSECGRYNTDVDCKSKEGKKLVEVVEKESG